MVEGMVIGLKILVYEVGIKVIVKVCVNFLNEIILVIVIFLLE